jgi:hypothetical protein
MTETAQALRDRTAVSGVGLLLGKYPERTSLSLAVEAYDIALADAGLERKDVDGIIQLSYGYDYDRFLEAVGADVRYAYQGWSHGRFVAPMLQHAAMAVATGNIGCMTQLASGSGVPVIHTVEFVDWANGGPLPEPLAQFGFLDQPEKLMAAQ